MKRATKKLEPEACAHCGEPIKKIAEDVWVHDDGHMRRFCYLPIGRQGPPPSAAPASEATAKRKTPHAGK